jgi:hypothetical protein
MLALPLTGAAAQGTSWLDGDMAPWNTAGMAVPHAPTIEGNTDPRCAENERPAETPEDRQLTAEGWRLFRAYQRGWGISLISALSAYDGMCRPLGYQWFVFVDGTFAGTISPQPMDSRTDGAATDVVLYAPDNMNATYLRYAPDDPLCCASGSDSVQFTIEPSSGGAVLVPQSSSS